MKQGFNPFLPSYEYIPDGEPHIFDGRVYLYGSHDRFNGKDYCENDYVCWSAPVDDLKEWKYEGIIYTKEDDPHKADRKILFAPDVLKGKDNRYYLYYSIAHSSVISVAVSDKPAGKYKYLGDVSLPNGHVYGSAAGDYYQFDPAVFMDDDGEIYLYSGFCPRQDEDELGRKYVGCHVCKLEDDYVTMKIKPKIVIEKNPDFYDETRYFEAPSMRKFNGKYYLIYSVRIGGLHYAMSKYPDRDFKYMGRLHSTSDVGINGFNAENPAYPNGNTHGSLIQIQDKYYVFDHRYSNESSYSRQAVAEEIFMYENGCFKQAEATSCGLNGGPLKAVGTFPSYIACILIDRNEYKDKEEKTLKQVRITQDGEDREEGESQYVSRIHNECVIGYKYFDYDEKYDEVLIEITIRGEAKGRLNIRSNYNGEIESFINIDCNNMTWIKEKSEYIRIKNHRKNALYFDFMGDGEFDLKEFRFEYM